LAPDGLAREKVGFRPPIDALVEGLCSQIQEITLSGESRAVEQHVDPAELDNSAPDNVLDLGFFRDIALKRNRAPTQGSNFSREPFCSLSFCIQHDAMRAFAGESDSDRAPAGILCAGN
jgi:hypothetical protein